MRILKIVSSRDKGGVLSCEQQYIEILKRQGVEVDLIISGSETSLEVYKLLATNYIQIDDIELKFAGNTVKRLIRVLSSCVFGLRFYRPLKKKLRSQQYNAIIYRRESFMFLAGFLRRHTKASCYWHMANSVNNRSSKILHNIICKALRIFPIANSRYTQRTIGKIAKHVIYPGFSVDRLSKPYNDDRFNLAIPLQAPIYGMIARISYEKAQDMLVSAFASSEAASKGAHLILAGDCDKKELLLAIRENAGALWNKQIHYIGLVTEVSKFYDLIDVAINSRRNAEPFGISIAEAMYMKKPVISYFLGGPSEMIDDGKNGWLVHDVSKNAYVDTLNRSIRDKHRWKEMGDLSYVKSIPFNSETNVQKLIDLL